MGGEHFCALQAPRPHSFVKRRFADVILFILTRAAVQKPFYAEDVSGEGGNVERRLAETFRRQIHRLVGDGVSGVISVVAVESKDFHEAI